MIYTSYMQNIKNIPKRIKKYSIMRYTPLWSKQVIDGEIRSLAPLAPTLLGYRNKLITRDEYVKYYIQQLSKLNIEKVKENLDNKVLLCTCMVGKTCHRHILAKYLVNRGLEITEVMPPVRPNLFDIEVIKSYTPNSIEKYKDYTFVFGDNLIGKGKKGQAVIREYSNTYGIPTKRLPTMNDNAFFSDKEDEIAIVKKKLEILKISMLEGSKIVLPYDGIGTGLAKLETHSRYIFEYIREFIDNNFLSFHYANKFKRRILVVGSRTYNNKRNIAKTIDGYISDIKGRKNILIISGGAKGVDSIAVEHSKSKEIETKTFEANWTLYDKKAGFIRNTIMGDTCTEAIVFWDGKSKGTKNMINILERMGKPYKLIKVK